MDFERSLEFKRRLYWIAAARAMLCLFAAAVIYLNAKPTSAVERMLPYAAAAAPLVLNLLYIGLIHAGRFLKTTATAATVLDVVFITGIVYSTGGVSSDFRLLYFGPILASAVLFHRNAALLVASFSTIGLFAGTAFYVTSPGGPLFVGEPWLARQPGSPGALVTALALQAAAFHLVAYLSSTLTWRLRSASIETEHILENMSDGVITVATNGRVVFANARAREMLGLQRGETLIGRSLADVCPGAACRAFVDVISRCRAVSIEVEMGLVPFLAQVTILPLFDHSAKLRGANVILHDLTEREHLMEALRRADRLEATAATVASIAHEIRNPLAAIRGSAQELRRALDLSGADGRLLDLVVRESDRLDRVLTEFLKFSRMPRAQMSVFDLRELLEEVAAQLRMSAGGKTPEVSVTGAAGARIHADSEQLRQVFVNLGLNALDATSGAGPVVFELAARRSDICVTTRDRGCGIEASIREKIFEPFFTTKTTGTGLGLPIAKQIVEEHGGSLEVEKDRDDWTCVKVFLPQAEREARNRAAASPESKGFAAG